MTGTSKKLVNNPEKPTTGEQLQPRTSCLPGALVAVVGQLVRDDLRPVQPPEPQPLGLVHAGLGSGDPGPS